MTTAFVYKWTHIPSQKWYIGSRTAKGCHLTDGYICSSNIVKPMILENKNDWKREILVIGEPKYIRNMERKILCFFDAQNDPNSFNMNNFAPIPSSAPRLATTGALNSFYGKKHILTKERNEKISKTLTGMLRSEVVKQKISLTVKSLPKKTCPYCNKVLLPMQYGRFHGEKCKDKIYV